MGAATRAEEARGRRRCRGRGCRQAATHGAVKLGSSPGSGSSSGPSWPPAWSDSVLAPSCHCPGGAGGCAASATGATCWRGSPVSVSAACSHHSCHCCRKTNPTGCAGCSPAAIGWASRGSSTWTSSPGCSTCCFATGGPSSTAHRANANCSGPWSRGGHNPTARASTQPAGGGDSGATGCRSHRHRWSGNLTVCCLSRPGPKCRWHASTSRRTSQSPGSCTATSFGWGCYWNCTCCTCYRPFTTSIIHIDPTSGCCHCCARGQATATGITSCNSRLAKLTGPHPPTSNCRPKCPTHWIWTDRSLCSLSRLRTHQCSHECCLCTS